MKKRILDLFCGAGGTGEGFRQVGFEVVGIDIKPQPRYPFPFILGDAIDILIRMIGGEKFLASDGKFYGIDDFDAFHASPPCQKYTKSSQQWRKEGRDYPDLVSDCREALKKTGKPYVIENVPNSPLINPIVLNGSVFGLLVHRPRLFESNFHIEQPSIPKTKRPIKMGRPVKEGDIIQPVGNFSGVAYAREQMQINWMTGKELSQAIPPAFTRFVGERLVGYLASGTFSTF